MPAEWEPQVAVWLSWPHKRASWPGQFRPVPHTFANIVAQITRFEEVRMCRRCVPQRLRESRARPGIENAGSLIGEPAFVAVDDAADAGRPAVVVVDLGRRVKGRE